MVSLSCKYHSLIQFLNSRGFLKEKQFNSIFTSVTGRNPGAAEKIFDKYLTHVRFELMDCGDQQDGHVCNGVDRVVNKVSNDQPKVRTKFSVPQTAFFKGIIEAMVQDEAARGWLSGSEALNIQLENQVPPSEASSSQQQVPPAFKNFSMSEKEETLDELVKNAWLCRTKGGYIGLGMKSLLDLRSCFRDYEVPSCEVCDEADGVKAGLCPNEYCFRNLLSQRDDKAAVNDDDEDTATQATAFSTNKRKHRS
ncbi:hypothetical protein IGI04_005156 [Brassica rapa subsp. trilocularis]|uniref:Non-structural maintenance of chromosomes element 1 homolog n=1 Tax=Brassica rapa subsp. trilocularis TaxID=1813537 RepID=A0ABQ7ND77_BRACM|nr:hypothetical protein IGI04_005156 [Brassica rapa subsp. trilocularis]